MSPEAEFIAVDQSISSQLSHTAHLPPLLATTITCWPWPGPTSVEVTKRVSPARGSACRDCRRAVARGVGWQGAGREGGKEGGKKEVAAAARVFAARRCYGSAALRPGLVAPSVLGRSRPRPLRRAGASRAGEGAGAAQAAPLQRRDAAARRRRRSALRHVLRPVVWTLPASAANLE